MIRFAWLRAFIVAGIALQLASQASACRVGQDQHLFAKAPASGVLPGAEIIRVRFSNERKGLALWPESAVEPDSRGMAYSLIGVARLLRDGVAQGQPFPVYAGVTSCSTFHGMLSDRTRPVVAGDYYLIGRFRSGPNGPRFHAGGLRADSAGRPIYEGWHF